MKIIETSIFTPVQWVEKEFQNTTQQKGINVDPVAMDNSGFFKRWWHFFSMCFQTVCRQASKKALSSMYTQCS